MDRINHDGIFGEYCGSIYADGYVDSSLNKVECIFCGDYHPIGKRLVVICPVKNISFGVVSCVPNLDFKKKFWAQVNIDGILDRLRYLEIDKLYIPRPWNSHGEWISKEELECKQIEFRIYNKPLRYIWLKMKLLFKGQNGI